MNIIMKNMKDKDVREEVNSRDGPEGENNNKSLFKDAKTFRSSKKIYIWRTIRISFKVRKNQNLAALNFENRDSFIISKSFAFIFKICIHLIFVSSFVTVFVPS